jgi:hypothetical protein
MKMEAAYSSEISKTQPTSIRHDNTNRGISYMENIETPRVRDIFLPLLELGHFKR